MKIKGIYVPIRGDYDQLQRDMTKARQIVSEQAKGMSNALNNALSPAQVQNGINRLVGNLGTLSRASQVTAKDFNHISADLGDLRKNLNVTDAQFASLQKRLLNTSAERAQERALRSIARAAKLTESEIRSLGIQMGMSKTQMQNVVNSINRVGKAGNSAGNMIGNSFTNAAANVFALQYAVETVFRVINAAAFDFNATMEVAQIGIASAFLTQGEYVDQLTSKTLEGEQAFVAAQQEAVRTAEMLKSANFATIATLEQLVKGYQVTLPVALARGFDNDQVVQFTLAMIQAAGAIDDTGALMHQLGEETRSMLTEAINPRTSRIATALGIRNEDIRKYRNNADELFGFLMDKLSAYQAAGDKLQSTWRGVWSNFLDVSQQASAMAFEPLFEAVKSDLKDILDDIVILDSATKQMKWNPEFIEGIQNIRSAVYAVIAEINRMGMLLDKIGGTLTAIGAIGTFGDWDEQMREWNAMFERRYQEGDRRLQELANREAGLNADGTSKQRTSKNEYRPKKSQTDAADGTPADWNAVHRKEVEYLKALEEKKVAVVKAAAALERQENENAYDLGLTSYQAYLNKKHGLTEKALQAELDAKKKALADAQTVVEKLKPIVDSQGNARPDKTAKARFEALKRVEEAEKDVITAQNKLTKAQAEGAHEVTLANIETLESYRDIEIQLMEMQGQDVEAARAQVAIDKESLERKQLIADAQAGIDEAQRALFAQKAMDDLIIKNAELDSLARSKEAELAIADITGEHEKSYDIQIKLLEIERERAELAGASPEELKLYDIQIERTENAKDPMGAFKQEWEDIANMWGNTSERMQDIAYESAQAMQDTFSDGFFDFMRGELDDLEDYLSAFGQAVQRAIADALAKKTAAFVMDTVGFHGGGVVGSDAPTFTRAIPAQSISSLPKYHTGLGANEFLAVLEKNETVFTEGQMQALGKIVSSGRSDEKSVSYSVPVTYNGGSKKESEDFRRYIDNAVQEYVRKAV